MFSYKNISIFSKTFMFAVLLFYIVDYWILDHFFYIFSILNPKNLINDFEVWRLVTFPLAPNSFESFVLFSLTFYYISSKLELLVDKVRYPFWLLTIVFLQGIVMTLFYWNKDIQISSMEGISFFILSFYTLIQPRAKIDFLKFTNIPVVYFSSSIALLWLSMKIGFSYDNTPVLFRDLNYAFFGIFTGLLIYLQVKFSQKMIKKKKISQIHNVPIPPSEELSLVMMSSGKFKRQYQKQRDECPEEDNYYYTLSNDAEENEQKLNMLLEKIHNSGKDSLSFWELKYLKDYSESLKN